MNRATSMIAGDSGPHLCFWCGGSCGERFPRKKFLSSTFNGWSEVFDRFSQWCCAGCVAMTQEPDPSNRPRFYSYLITPTRMEKANKGQMDLIRGWCLNPPADENYSIILATSGKKQLAYRAPVNDRADIATVQFETEQVTYRPAELNERLILCKKLAAASGKPALIERPTAQLATRLAQYWADFEPLLIWSHVWSEPVSRLAAWLCPKQETCANEYPSNYAAPVVRRERVAATTGRVDGPGLFDAIG